MTTVTKGHNPQLGSPEDLSGMEKADHTSSMSSLRVIDHRESVRRYSTLEVPSEPLRRQRSRESSIRGSRSSDASHDDRPRRSSALDLPLSRRSSRLP